MQFWNLDQILLRLTPVNFITDRHYRQRLPVAGHLPPGIRMLRLSARRISYEVLITFLAISGFAFAANDTGCGEWVYRKNRLARPATGPSF